MKTRALLTALALVCGLLLVAPGMAEPGASGPAARTVLLHIVRPDGSDAELTFEVLAGSDAEARDAALRALAQVAPAARVVEPVPGEVSAQWLPWTWKWTDSEIPVPVAYNPTNAPPSVGPQVVVAGLQAWSSVATSSFRFNYAGITDNTATILDFGPDGENVLSWATLDCTSGCVLGVTSKDTAHEVDMLLNNNPAAADQLGVGTTVDWRTVILHELGHVAGLEHSCPVPFGPCTQADADAVMFSQSRGILRTLAPDDILGLSKLYPLAPGATPTPGTPGATPSPFPEYPVILEGGWNLLVLPELAIAQLSNGLPCLQAVYEYSADDWFSWIRGAPDSIQEITSVSPTRSYWLMASGFCAHDFP